MKVHTIGYYLQSTFSNQRNESPPCMLIWPHWWISQYSPMRRALRLSARRGPLVLGDLASLLGQFKVPSWVICNSVEKFEELCRFNLYHALLFKRGLGKVQNIVKTLKSSHDGLVSRNLSRVRNHTGISITAPFVVMRKGFTTCICDDAKKPKASLCALGSMSLFRLSPT